MPAATLHSSGPSACLIACLALLGQLPSAHAADPLSYNTGSIGVAGNGTHTNSPQLDQAGALKAFGDYSVTYAAGNRTQVPFLPQLNPASSSPFTIEFWAKPSLSNDNNAPVANRIATGNRSGWVFFQRAPATGWNFRMYDGNGSTVGWSLTGGTSTLGAWSHVVCTWDGSSARLFVNGSQVDDTNDAASGIYNASTSAIFSVGALSTAESPFSGSIDEVAFYPTALTLVQITNHFNAAASPAIGSYSAQVLADGAVEYLQQNPPAVSIANAGAIPSVSFTGILAQSTDLTTWQDLAVASPYTPPAPASGTQFFRAHR